MKIIKIGGTALSNLSNIIDFANTTKHSNRPILLVISAFSKLSSNLKNYDFSAVLTENNSPFSIFREISSILSHSECVNFFTYLDKVEIILTKRAKGISISDELPPKVMDEILSFGELVSSYYVHCLLNTHEINNDFIDARELIRTDSNFENARIDLENSVVNISKKVFKSDVNVTQGFIASDASGNTTTMGFESSNLSALVFANALETDEIEIVTKVNHIYSTDPELYTTAKPVQHIPYSSAKTLANNGFKMLFPGMIDLAEKKNITLTYRGIKDEKRTVISGKKHFDLPVVLPTNKGFIVAPITSTNAIKITTNFDIQIDGFTYSRLDDSLSISSTRLDEKEVHDFAISLC